MREEVYYPSAGKGKIHASVWTPDGDVKAVVQIVHGIAEHVFRYDGFASYLNGLGFAVVAEDHMGHGLSSAEPGLHGYFHGGWFAAIKDTMKLMEMSRERFGDAPHFLFGHSMGSFMVRTILAKYPDSGIHGCIICGTGWQSAALLKAGIPLCKMVCKKDGEKAPGASLHKIVFGGYNKRVEHKRTNSDWLSRDKAIVDAYEKDPLCGFIPSAGLMRDMMLGISYIQKKDTLNSMNKDTPCFFIAGAEDPVGNYGKGVVKTSEMFKKAGMKQVDIKLYPLCRHEILNELNREEIYKDVVKWLDRHI